MTNDTDHPHRCTDGSVCTAPGHDDPLICPGCLTPQENDPRPTTGTEKDWCSDCRGRLDIPR